MRRGSLSSSTQLAESDGAGNEDAQCEDDYGGVFGQTNRPVLSKSQLKRRRRKVRGGARGVVFTKLLTKFLFVRECVRGCVGKARQCGDDRGLQGKGKPTQGSSGEADQLAQAGAQ
jgi:hypothetical protein